MKKIAMLAVLGAALLSGCASTQQTTSSTQAMAQAAAPSQSVQIPAFAAKKVVLHMSGPKTVMEAKDWESFKEEWRATFAEHAKGAGVSFSMQDGESRPAGDAGTLLSIYINDYRMVGIGARVFLGVLTGNAYIDAKASYRDLKTGTVFGSQTYNTSSSAWGGVVGKMTPQQVDTIAAGVFQELKAAR